MRVVIPVCSVCLPAQPCFVRSDYPNSNELHTEDYCFLAVDGNRFVNDGVVAPTPAMGGICEMEVSSKCERGWTFYKDSGTEGADSCLYVSSYRVSSWAEANASCPSGSHLLTISSSSNSTGLSVFAGSLFRTSFAYIGCYQSPSATQRAQGWSWVDGTPAANLNCGSGSGGGGCGVWGADEPR
jgi:hypothetical protein